MRTFEDLFESLLVGDESTEIEAKRATDVGKSLLFTISAYANEPGLGGGYVLLGVVKEDGGYTVVGVSNPDKLQSDLAAQCATDFNCAIRPQLAVETYEGKTVIVMRVPEADPNDKPVYLKKYGLPKGACLRIGSTDQTCSDDDVARLYQLRQEQSYDSAIVSGAVIEDIDPAAIREYRQTRLNQDAEELQLKNNDLLIAVGAAVRKKSGELAITRAGLLVFGKQSALRRLMPSARVDYMLVPGSEWVADASQSVRSTEIRQNLLMAVPRISQLILQDLPSTVSIKGKGLRRKEIPAIPQRVIREAIVNAVMHRSYRWQKPIQIIRFSNRLEIRNPGHSLVATEELGHPGSRTRNENIAAVLHDCGYAETKGMGIKVMREQMRAANMTEPIFRSSRPDDSFEVTLFSHHLLDADTIAWLSRFSHLSLTDDETKALVVVREKGFIDNVTYRNINNVDVLAASLALRRLRDIGLLESHGRSTATFYKGTAKLFGSKPSNPQDKAAKQGGFESQSVNVSPELVGLLKRLGGRTASRELMEIAIMKLCALKPMTTGELSKYMGRAVNYLQVKFIASMIKEGKLAYLYPDTPAHPRQAYVTPPGLLEIPIPGEPRARRRKSKLPLFD